MRDDLTIEEMRKWESLDISNAFIFYRVMRDNPERCCRLLQRILPELDIKRVEFVDTEKSIDEAPNSRGVRLDAFAGDDENRKYDIEMQVNNEDNIPKRSRYNQSMVDSQMLDKGAMYDELPDSYVIFICKFDLFGRELYRYTFRYVCSEDESLVLGYGAEKIFLNPKGTKGDISKELKAFLDLINGIHTEDSFVRELEDAVDIVKKSSEARRAYMTWDMDIRVAARNAASEAKMEEKQQMVARLLRQGKLSYDDISECTELDLDKIRQIANEIGLLTT